MNEPIVSNAEMEMLFGSLSDEPDIEKNQEMELVEIISFTEENLATRNIFLYQGLLYDTDTLPKLLMRKDAYLYTQGGTMVEEVDGRAVHCMNEAGEEKTFSIKVLQVIK